MKVDIIGGGMAGLSLGIHLRKQGIETTIYEQHSICGGLCTGWQRGQYNFNGCLHWILGTQKGISFHTFWTEIFDIDSVDFHYFEERTQITLPIADRHGNRTFRFINDIDRFEQYLLDIAPEDRREIVRWARRIRFLMPLLEYLPPAFDGRPWHKQIPLLLELTRLTPLAFFMLRWSRYSNVRYAQRFKNPFLRTAVANLYENEMRMTVLMFAQAYAAKRVAGYPIGGSALFAHKLEQTYLRMGGRLLTSTPVKRVIIENGTARGLELADGRRTEADFVASAADWHWTSFTAIGKQWLTKPMQTLERPHPQRIFYSFCMMHLGVACSLTHRPHFQRIPIEPLTSPDGTRYDQMEIHIYNYDPTLAPEGKTAMSVNFTTREGLYWIGLRNDNRPEYDRQKQRFADEIMARLAHTDIWPDIDGKIEATTMTTPATYNRYTGNYAGSSQGWSPFNNILKSFEVKRVIPKLQRFVMAGHWINAGGGIPVAIYSARKAAQYICKQMNIKFNTDNIKTFIKS